jgi:hypothetical protein
LAAVLLISLIGFVSGAGYITFIAGTTSGPDVIQAGHSGQLAPATVTSIEVFGRRTIPLTPSSMSIGQWDYYQGLPRQNEISEPAQIHRLLSACFSAQAGRKHQNHPSTMFRAFLRINVRAGHYWVECTRLDDGKSDVLQLNANTLNATNPNGSSSYYLEDFSEVLSIIESQNAKVTENAEKSN